MALNTENDPLMCKCFPTSLAGPALNWFKNLSRGSVDSFRSLCDRFISQYYGNKRPAKDISSLFTMKQHNDERLQAFLTRFNLTKSMVIECHPSTVVQAFKLAMTRGTPFHTSLVVNTSKTMDELNERADGFVHLENEESVNARKTSIISKEEKSKAKIRQKQVLTQRQTSWKAEKRPKEDDLITPLKVTLARLYQENKDKNLRRQVEMLIARGEFAGYVQGPAQEQSRLAEQVKRNQKLNPHNTQPVQIINAIHGRPEQTVESEELLRTRLRQAQMKRRVGSVNTLHQQSSAVQIRFDRTDLMRVQILHEDPLVVSLTVAECLVCRVLINLGSSANIMPRVTFDRLEIKPEELKSIGNLLLGFDGKRVEPVSTVELVVRTAERDLVESFVVVEIYPSYNLLIGRGWIHRVQGVPSTLQQVMKCLSPDGSKVIDIHGDQVAIKECYSVTLRAASKDVFAWSHSDMPGIDPSVSYHSLNVDPNIRPVKQKQKRFTPERNQIIAEEVNQLLEAGFIREVQYPSWLLNVVIVQKKNGKWRVCIDFTNLNKACPKDSFPLPKIDQWWTLQQDLSD
ncbi:uncharacterized protein LOC132273040 [Cornus florida]|uniref:uncharacterized protein LOC132273040 n=1 Tax=Cornus florida TaxID=4283 RepID=UPI00289682B7|nr:uncharacterized protein LOC132273040 [Cornus florida]